jgi:putative intracellular protease/amidase
MSRRILMVLTSRAKLGDTDQPTGAWLEELAASYNVFVDAGSTVTLASPAGGAAPIDPMSLQEPWLTADGKRFLEDETAQRALASTAPLSKIDARQFDAIYLVGGAATAWDFPSNPTLTGLVEQLHRAGKPVSGVCHGVLGLSDARSSSGASILQGRKVTGISNAEETLTGFDKVVPVLPENRLKERGGQYSCAGPLECHVMVDDIVLTGQNPASAGPLARAVLTRLASE